VGLSYVGASVGPSFGSRAAATVAGGCREEVGGDSGYPTATTLGPANMLGGRVDVAANGATSLGSTLLYSLGANSLVLGAFDLV